MKNDKMKNEFLKYEKDRYGDVIFLLRKICPKCKKPVEKDVSSTEKIIGESYENTKWKCGKKSK